MFQPRPELLCFDCQSAAPCQFSGDVAAWLFFWFPLHISVSPFPSLTRESPRHSHTKSMFHHYSRRFANVHAQNENNHSILFEFLSFLHSFICKLIKYQVLGHFYVSTSRLTQFTSPGNVSFVCNLSSRASSTSQILDHTISIRARSPSSTLRQLVWRVIPDGKIYFLFQLCGLSPNRP